MKNLVLVGLGYWGPNLLRTFNSMGYIKAAVDKDVNKLNKFKSDPIYNNIAFVENWQQFLITSSIKGFIIATPPNTHYEIAKAALSSGKHVFIEKPMTLNPKESEELCIIAEEYGLVIMVGHIFLYSPEIVKLKELVSNENFGNIQYIYTTRLNLGKIQSPANVIDDLAPHDISILNYLLDSSCTKAQVIAKAHVIDTEDVAFVNLKYGDVLCNLHLSWLDPLKVRSTVVVGTKQMAVCDSMNKTIHLYNKGVDVEKLEGEMSNSYSNYLMTYRYGDVLIPHIENVEPMMTECREFINCVENKCQPLASGRLGLDVVKTLNAIRNSLSEDGKWVNV